MLLITSISVCQTIEKEEDNWSRRLQEKERSPEEMRSLINEWFSIVESRGGYPKLPYNKETNELEYTYIKSYSLTKEVITNRILEWVAFSFGSLNAVLHYKEEKSGKIIIKGQFSIAYASDYINFWGTKKEETNSKNCFQTYIFTVKDNKLKIQITSIEIENVLSGYGSSSYYVPERRYKIPLRSLYPVSLFKQIDWKENLNILENVDKNLNLLVYDLDKYINDYTRDYSF